MLLYLFLWKKIIFVLFVDILNILICYLVNYLSLNMFFIEYFFNVF